MQSEKTPALTATISPHLKEGTTTARIMWTVSLCLLPASAWGIYVFGIGSLVVLLLSIGFSVLTELAVNAVRGRLTITDGSAFLTGLLIGMNLPPSVPFYIPLIASVFAVAIVKHAFGGLGSNWMNPALAGRVFVMFSFQGPMSTWTLPRTLVHGADAVTGASPLGAVKSGLLELSNQFLDKTEFQQKIASIGGSLEFLAGKQYPVTGFDTQVTGWLNQTFGLKLHTGYVDLFFGNVPGTIGEISVFLLLIGAAVLFIRRIISWEIPVSYIGSFGLFIWLFDGLRWGQGLLHGDVLFHLLTGGLVLGAFFMATDYVTSPLSRRGKLIFGVGVGFLTFLIRLYGSLPEGVSLAIIIMNMAVPLIDRYTKPVIFGSMKKTAPKNPAGGAPA
ncbi:MAG TPA: electron transporter RnfD [Spirochaetia bacterium]|nr:electron transporter RnfD [Spirochaetia bacterium]